MRIHYVLRHTGQFTTDNKIDSPDGPNLRHDDAKPWAVIRVAPNGRLTYCVSKHAKKGTAQGVVTRRNRKLGIA